MEKFIYYNGLKFTRDDKTGYYLNSTNRKRLHRYVWESVNGDIPEGYEIHHKDGDKSNNDISNLELLTKEKHRQYHIEHMTEETKARLRGNMIEHAQPAAAEWHKSERGREWHKEHYKQFEDRLHKKYWIACKNCNTVFEGQQNAAFCCNACKSAYRRHKGVDNIIKICPVCGREHATNKYQNAETCSRSCANVLRARRRHESKICTAS